MRKLHSMLAMGAVLLPVAFAPPSFAADAKAKHHDDAAMQREDTSADADNTKRNARDADGNTLTPMDQGNSKADMSITQQIRKAVVDSDKLSTNAKNIKIITQNGVVTLRGPVKTPEEKATIASVAQKTGGVKRVDNQLEIERD
jgi:hyperosmotically inducible periplasmic protein